jgi:hypothetical protein
MGNRPEFKSDPGALFFFSPLKKPNGKSKVIRFDANKYFPMAEGPEWDTHIGTRARILKAIAEEDRRSDQDAKEAMFEAYQECTTPGRLDCHISVTLEQPKPEDIPVAHRMFYVTEGILLAPGLFAVIDYQIPVSRNFITVLKSTSHTPTPPHPHAPHTPAVRRFAYSQIRRFHIIAGSRVLSKVAYSRSAPASRRTQVASKTLSTHFRSS